MWLALLSLAAATSFTDPKSGKSDSENWLIAAAEQVNKPSSERSWIPYFPNDWLVAVCKSVSNRSNLARLIQCVDSSGMDALCNELQYDDPDLDFFLRKYDDRCSKWKRHQEWKDENRPQKFFPWNDPAENEAELAEIYARNMFHNPLDIFDHHLLNKCMNHWTFSNMRDSVRQICMNSGVLRGIDHLWLKVYDNRHEKEYVVMIVKRVKKGWLDNLDIPMPWRVTMEQLEPLAFLIESCTVWKPGKLGTHVGDKAVKLKLEELNGIIEKKGYHWNHFGGEYELFMGRSPIEGRYIHRNPAKASLPLPLERAADVFMLNGFEATLRNSLAVAGGFEEAKKLCDAFYVWLKSLVRFTPRVKQAFALFKPYLGSRFNTRDDYEPKGQLLPLYQDMIDHPEDYWPDEIKEKGTAFARLCLRKSRAMIDAMFTEATAEGLVSLASDPYWRERAWPLLKQRQGTINWQNLASSLNETDEFAVIVDLWQEASPEQKDAMKPFWPSALAKAQVAMAISANIRLLDLFLKVMSPLEIVAGCSHLVAKRRISVMLHLHPGVQSYHKRELVNKNSLRFRDWVLLKLPCTGHRVADLKLLDYFFSNCMSGAYSGFMVNTGGETQGPCWVGLLGDQAQLPEYNKIVQLSLEPEEVPVPVWSLRAKCLSTVLWP